MRASECRARPASGCRALSGVISYQQHPITLPVRAAVCARPAALLHRLGAAQQQQPWQQRLPLPRHLRRHPAAPRHRQQARTGGCGRGGCAAAGRCTHGWQRGQLQWGLWGGAWGRGAGGWSAAAVHCASAATVSLELADLRAELEMRGSSRELSCRVDSAVANCLSCPLFELPCKRVCLCCVSAVQQLPSL